MEIQKTYIIVEIQCEVNILLAKKALEKVIFEYEILQLIWLMLILWFDNKIQNNRIHVKRFKFLYIF